MPPLLLQRRRDSVKLTLLDTRSLKKHSDDILSDVDLLSNDVLCSTEKQLQLHENTSEITSKFQKNFRMYFNSNRDQHKIITFGYSSSMLLHDSSDYGSMPILLFNVQKTLIFRSIGQSSTVIYITKFIIIFVLRELHGLGQ